MEQLRINHAPQEALYPGKDRTMDTIIKLHDIIGISRLNGIDCHGNHWTQFEVDYLADQTDGECVICGAVLSSGWMCLDGADEVCDKHVQY